MNTYLSFVCSFLFCAKINTSQNPDLSIQNINIKPSKAQVGDKIVISYQVKNVGNVRVAKETYSTSLSINGELVSLDDETNALDVGQTITYTKAEGTYHKLIDKKGSYKWEIKVKTKFRDANPKDNVEKGVILVE